METFGLFIKVKQNKAGHHKTPDKIPKIGLFRVTIQKKINCLIKGFSTKSGKQQASPDINY